MSKMADLSQYTLPNSTDVCLLDCMTAFKNLTDQEKRYAHHVSQAAWYGGLIVLVQTSPESPGIFLLLQKMFRAQSVDELKTLATTELGLSPEEFDAILIYASGFYANMGNYKSFGDSKFIPNLPKEKFEAVVLGSAACKSDPDKMKALWNAVSDRLYSLENRQRELGLGEKGTTTYFSSNCDLQDAEVAQEFLTAKNLSAYNTRLFKKCAQGSGPVEYEVRLASVETENGPLPGCPDGMLGSHKFTPKGWSTPVTFNVTRGDYSKLMAHVAQALEKAKSAAANDNEVKMLEEYIKSFKTGSIPAHKDGSRYWIRNTGPVVETYIGFIESYRDPFGVRGEFEGFVAVVNKEMSAKFGALVENAEHLLAKLPWPQSYEKDKFLRPDFTSLEVLTFGGSGIPAGINIPNYNEIRQDEGFKNVSLGNVLTAGYKDTKVTFLSDADKELYTKLKIPSFEVQVGLHELLGHGSGKLFHQDENGKFNFDINSVTHTETGGKIDKWYKAGETWESQFSTIAPTYEECRAECVGIYLCLATEALRIFGHEDDDGDDIVYINWLNMVRAGLLALEFYSPETRAWRQAHMNARFVILRVLLEAGEDLVKVEKIKGEDGNPDIRITLDRSKIISVGKPAIGDFLRKLQVYKATADVKNGKEMYDRYSDVHDSDEPHFISLREIVLARKQPRKMFVQHNTSLCGDGSISLASYEASPGGLIQSWVDRFPNTDVDNIIEELWSKDKPYFE
ncbi:dipeptidyl peptidase 3-like isoform X2 [Ruditapes philippinarum]|uniref:dipeptidyl peptidase 3-like isoform X2 n=1 Tax=Ruditapes philippinarum TaxID=129788 RepID=UPI00295B36B1|nr:dipeptidyl peptidase 3-like isoform X2 [Ruditapes philippinarum]